MIYNKLVRDNIPAIIEADNKVAVTRTLAGAEFEEELRRKLLEVAAAAAAENDPTELADVLEVVYALAKLHNLSPEELETIRALKADKRGGFSDKIYLIETKEA